jgi:hypothetical protein
MYKCFYAKPIVLLATIQIAYSLFIILDKSYREQLSTHPMVILSFVGNTALVHGFFYAPKSQEDQEW